MTVKETKHNWYAHHLVFRAAEQGACASIEDGVCGGTRGGSLLGDFIV